MLIDLHLLVVHLDEGVRIIITQDTPRDSRLDSRSLLSSVLAVFMRGTRTRGI